MSPGLRDSSTLGRSSLIVLLEAHREEFLGECGRQGDNEQAALAVLRDFEDEALAEALAQVLRS